MGSAAFSAQYQQSPIPPGGNMISWDWFRWYDRSDVTVEEIVISWDTAMKATELSDYSVGTVWGVRGDLGSGLGPRSRFPMRCRWPVN